MLFCAWIFSKTECWWELVELGKDWLQYMVYKRQLVLGGGMSGESYPPLTCWLSLAVNYGIYHQFSCIFLLLWLKIEVICKHTTFMNQADLISFHLYMLTIVLAFVYITLNLYTLNCCWQNKIQLLLKLYLPYTNTQNIKECQKIKK